MLRQWSQCVAVALIVCQLSLAQDNSKQLDQIPDGRSQEWVGAAKNDSPGEPSGWAPAGPEGGNPFMEQKTPAKATCSCIELDILIGCVEFDAKGELRVEKEGVEPEVNRAGTLGANLAAKLNEEKGKLPAGFSPGAAGANFLLKGLGGGGKLRSLEQFRLRLSADGGKSHLQNGNRVPRVTGTAMRGKDIANTVQFENVGVLAGGSAQITEAGKIALVVQVEQSSFGPEEEGTPVSVSEGQTVRTPRIDTMTLETRATVADGESTVLSSLVRSWGDKVTETFVVVAATVVEP